MAHTLQILDKHFLDAPSTLVVDSLKGLCAVNPRLSLDISQKVVYQANVNRGNVALICGGGSGHEPAHAGFVGQGMLTAAVCGNVFASPNASQVMRGIELTDNDKGNYTGDILNFGLAKEKYAALHPNKSAKVKFVVVADDVAVGKTQGAIVGRRGLAGTVLVYKIAGALAAKGANLEDVHNIAEYVSSRLGTIGVGLEHCHVPGSQVASSHLSSDELEIGMGIHNEPGNMRLSPVPPLHSLLDQLISLITSTSDPERGFLPFQNDGTDEIVLLVNNLGGISELELGGIVNGAVTAFNKINIKIRRILAGTFMTSLNMPGFSLTALLLPRHSESPSINGILDLLDADADAPGWKWSSRMVPPDSLAEDIAMSSATNVLPASTNPLRASSPIDFKASIKRACEALIAEEPNITRMDSIAGDGDCGFTLKSGAEGIALRRTLLAVLSLLQSDEIDGNDITRSILSIGRAVEGSMSGTSGALYSIFFSSLAQGLSTVSETRKDADVGAWSEALHLALNRFYTYTRARPPSRTLVDPLDAFVKNIDKGFELSVKAAAGAALETANYQAKAGRSAYVEDELLKKEKIPDPGAYGVKIILEAL